MLVENNGLLEDKEEDKMNANDHIGSQIGEKIIAKRIVVQIGSKNNECTWGILPLGAVKVRVALIEILVQNTLLPCSDGKFKTKEIFFWEIFEEQNPSVVVI